MVRSSKVLVPFLVIKENYTVLFGYRIFGDLRAMLRKQVSRLDGCLAYPSVGSPFYNLSLALHGSDAIKRTLLAFYHDRAMIAVTPFMNVCLEVLITSALMRRNRYGCWLFNGAYTRPWCRAHIMKYPVSYESCYKSRLRAYLVL